MYGAKDCDQKDWNAMDERLGDGDIAVGVVMLLGDGDISVGFCHVT